MKQDSTAGCSTCGRRRTGTLFSAIATLAVLGAVLTPMASADTVVCGPGAGAGQCDNPGGVAIDPGSEELYVADTGNRRIDAFGSEPTLPFQRAFGWGVADGGVELQVCTATCILGLAGGGAGQLRSPDGISVDPASNEVYVLDNLRVQRFSAAGEFLGAWGGGVVSGGAAGSGDLTAGSEAIADVKTDEKTFEVSQTISGAGIPPETKVAAVGAGTITLSNPATASGDDVAISVTAGAGNVAVNEVQDLTSSSFGNYRLTFRTPDPSPSVEQTAPISPEATAAEVQAALEALPNIPPGSVEVEGPAGSPYLIEFKGARFADTNVDQLTSGGVGSRTIITRRNGGGAAEICTPAEAQSCSGGVAAGIPPEGDFGVTGDRAGQFASGSTAIAVGPGGAVHVADSVAVEGVSGGREFNGYESRLQTFEPSGAFVSQFTLSKGDSAVRGIAVDSTGAFYVATGQDGVRKYDTAGNLLSLVHSGTGLALAVDAADSLFVAGSDFADPGNVPAIFQYDSAGNPVRTFYGELQGNLGGIAPLSSATGDLLVAEGAQSRVLHVPFPPPGPVVHPKPSLTEAPSVGNTKATLVARINPEGEATDYRFQYLDRQSFEEQGGFEGPATLESEEKTLEPGPGEAFSLNRVETQIGCPDPVEEAELSESDCLTPETEYRFRAVASNASGEDIGPEATFTTGPPLEIVDSWSTGVGIDTARLHGLVNPFGIPATGRFQYVEETSFQESEWEEAAETAELDFGASSEATSASTQLRSLASGTSYRYRLLAENPLLEEPIVGPELSFATYPLPRSLPSPDPCANAEFRTGPGARLPECRAYELVSPLDKANGEIAWLLSIFLSPFGNPPARLNQAAPGGAKITYSSYRAFGDSEGAHFSSQYLAEREPGSGWVNRAINHPREGPSLYSQLGKEIPYQAFSEDLCSGWFWQDTQLALVPGAPEGVPNLYRRQMPGSGCGPQGYELLTTVDPPGFGKATEGLNSTYFPMASGFSADGSVSVFRAPAALSADACDEPEEGKGISQLYASTGGVPGTPPRLVSVLPGGEAACGGAALGSGGETSNFRIADVDNAVSADASRVFFTTAGALYVRLNPLAGEESPPDGEGNCVPDPALACTLEVSAGPGTRFWAADPAGSVALFTAGEELYELDVDAAIAGKEATTLIAGQVKGLMGASEDATRAYLVSEEDLDGAGPAQAGEPNLYLHEQGAGFTFVVALAEADLGPPSPTSATPYNRRARVTADGAHTAFMSRGRLTGYDNTVTGKGEPAAEVFLYDATDDELRCASCMPTGGRPEAARNFKGEGGLGESAPFWIAAKIPGWESQTHAARALAEDGERMFFESFEALVLRDTNGRQDVYEWRAAASEAQCEAAGVDLYVPRAGGCISLISSGESPADSAFVDASASGSDVFFVTSRSLVPADYGLTDIYDARIGGGFPPPPPPAQPCEGEACQSPPPAPEAVTPASSAYEGKGNLPPARLSCGAFARQAKRLARQAKRFATRARKTRRAAARASAARRTRAMRRRAKRFAAHAKRRAAAAKKRSTRAKRCRARARKAARASQRRAQR